MLVSFRYAAPVQRERHHLDAACAVLTPLGRAGDNAATCVTRCGGATAICGAAAQHAALCITVCAAASAISACGAKAAALRIVMALLLCRGWHGA